MNIIQLTTWLSQQEDLTAGRLAYLIREKGVDPKTLICVKIFPNIQEATGGVVITLQGEVFQFVFNRSGMRVEMAVIDEWLNITKTYTGHPWRDEIFEGLALLQRSKGVPG